MSELELGATVRAGIGLGMKPSIARVLVFSPADGTHLKGSHGGMRTVVRDIFYDGEARAAISAVDEWVGKAKVIRMKELLPTFIAGGDIW